MIPDNDSGIEVSADVTIKARVRHRTVRSCTLICQVASVGSSYQGAMSGKLIVLAGPEAGRKIELPEGATLRIGRGEASSTRLNDPRISRVHCTVEVSSKGVILKDAGSSGGSFVNGQRVTQQQLAGAAGELLLIRQCSTNEDLQQFGQRR